jgi:hypothetical protein
MPTPKPFILNTVKVSIASLLPTHATSDLPGPLLLSSLGIEADLFERLLVRCALVLSNAQNGGVRSVYLRANIQFDNSLSLSALALQLEPLLKNNAAFATCGPPQLPSNPSPAQCKVWKNGSVSCRVVLALEDWAEPSTVVGGISANRPLSSFHAIPWNLGLFSALVEATNARQPFAPFLHERVTFPPALPPGTTTVAQWRDLVLQLRNPITECA